MHTPFLTRKITPVALLVVAAVAAMCAPADASQKRKSHWSVNAYLGGAANFRTTIDIEMNDGEKDSWSTGWETRALESPLYWAARINWHRHKETFELQFIHDKLFMQNQTVLLQAFSMSHGFNIITLNYARKWYRTMTVRAGAGAVLAYPEANVRGETAEGTGSLNGYEVTGPAGLVGIGSSTALGGPRFSLNVEGQFVGSFIRVPVQGGNVSTSNLSFHLLIGIGYHF
jgi:hypothetical protein